MNPFPPDPSPAVGPAAPPPRHRRLSPLVVLGVLALVGLAAWATTTWWQRGGPKDRSEAPPDPRLIYTGPFRNVHPDVKYVGDAACAGCHPLETQNFHQHPMARSVLPIKELFTSQILLRPTPFKALDARFVLAHRGDRLFNQERRLDRRGKVLAEFETEIAYTIGSGQRGYSFLAEEDGFVFQTSISWFAQRKKWDLSPGFQTGSLREVTPACLFCHAGSARPVEHTVNRYQEPVFSQVSIGCERCHGPGDLHVRSRQREELPPGNLDPTIVNPRHLDPELKEHVCQQCHLQGAARILRRGRGLFDYRPGLPLDDFWAIFVAGREVKGGRKAVSHVELMHRSRCFRATAGTRKQLGCTTCHDAHERENAEQRVAHYRSKCLECHGQEHPCTLDRASRLKASAEDSCISCHMPRFLSADIAHTAPTDHSIPLLAGAAPRTDQREAASPGPLIPFHQRRREARGPEADSDLGQALMEAFSSDSAYARYLLRAERLLARAESHFPRDVSLLLRLAEARAALRRFEGARAALEKALAVAPDDEVGLRLASFVNLNLRRYEEALRYCERALAANPRQVANYFQRAVIQIQLKDWDGALATCRRVQQLQPTLVPPHIIMAHCYDKLGRPAQAAAEQERANALGAAEAEQFRDKLRQVLGQ